MHLQSLEAATSIGLGDAFIINVTDERRWMTDQLRKELNVPFFQGKKRGKK